MKAEILKMLRQSDGYVSGQQLCDTFQVSRTAVWKVINQLKDEGYQIEAVRNRGYHIVNTPELLSKEELESRMDTAWAGRNVWYGKEVDSTNSKAKLLGEEDAPHGLLVVADKQTAGRGRRGRAWESPEGSSIYMTLLLRPEVAPAKAPMLTLVMAQSVAEAVREMTGLEAMIKWPNDIVLNGKKICGILTEMSAEIDYIHYVVIGVGINVNMQSFPEELCQMATSLWIEGEKKIGRSELIACIMRRFEVNYALFIKDENLASMMDSYNQILVNRGKEVRIMEPGREHNAFALGIDESGELMVKTKDGGKEQIFSGEVSVRGLYGYA